MLRFILMKKILGILILGLICNIASAASKYVGTGLLKLQKVDLDYFEEYVKPPAGQSPNMFYIISENGKAIWATYWYCPTGACQTHRVSSAVNQCKINAEKYYNRTINADCKIFAKRRTIVWDNQINPGKGKVSTINSKMDSIEIKNKLTELGFLGDSVSSSEATSPKIIKEKKKSNKIVKKYEVNGERSIALSWEGYEDLIAGTVKFNEADYKGTLNVPLPNNDGTCDGTYSLQKGGKGTWQIACSNNMGAAGTLKWVKNGGVTGIGRDHNDKKVKFTVSKKNS